MSVSTLISTEQLKAATGFDTNHSLERCLREQRVPFLYGKNGAVWTTAYAVNSALGLTPGNDEPDDITFSR